MNEDFLKSLKQSLAKLSKNDLIRFCIGQQVEIDRLTFFLQSKPEGKILLMERNDDGSVGYNATNFEE